MLKRNGQVPKKIKPTSLLDLLCLLAWFPLFACFGCLFYFALLAFFAYFALLFLRGLLCFAMICDPWLCWFYLLGWLFACSLARLLARLLACLLFWFALLAYFDLFCLINLRGSRGWTPETQPNDALVEFLVFNLLALVFLELARLFFSLVCLLVLLWFGLVRWLLVLLLFALLCFAWFALLCLLGVLFLLGFLCCVTICDAWLDRFHLPRLCLSPLGLVWLGRLNSCLL